MSNPPCLPVPELCQSILQELGVDPALYLNGNLEVCTPIDGSVIGRPHAQSAEQVALIIDQAQAASLEWRDVPAPQRSELVRLLGEELRAGKERLGRLVSLETGNAVVWKPSEKTPLTALASQALFERALERFGKAPSHLNQLVLGDRSLVEVIVDS